MIDNINSPEFDNEVFDEDTEQNIDNILECIESITLDNQEGQLICNKSDRVIDIKLDCEIYIHEAKENYSYSCNIRLWLVKISP